MSRIVKILKNKNRLEKEAAQRRGRELLQMKKEASYKAVLKDSLKQVNSLLDKGVRSVIVEIDRQDIPDFTRVIYEPEMAEYTVTQISATRFSIARKEVDF